MEENPYLAPTAEVSSESREDFGTGSVRFFPVSITKLVVMEIATMGLYHVYWFYKNWKYEMEARGEKIRPFWRAIFSIFYTHSLFRKVCEGAKRRDINVPWKPELNATVVVILLIVARVTDNIAEKMEAITLLDFISLVCVPLLLLLTIPVQRTINEINSDPEGRLNSRFTVPNILWLLFGGLLWFGVFFGLYLELTGTEL